MGGGLNVFIQNSRSSTIRLNKALAARMNPKGNENLNSVAGSESSGISDAVLVDRARAGDDAALRALMIRYDRLVRFTIFRIARDRCRSDPSWLATVASDAWMGFVRSIRRADDAIETPAAYLVRIARNKAISALRAVGREMVVLAQAIDGAGEDSRTDRTDAGTDPIALLSTLEEFEALRACLTALDPEDQPLAARLSDILERRWRDAAEALGWPESTVRSRWNRVLARLRACMEGKTGRPFAPPASESDNLSG